MIKKIKEYLKRRKIQKEYIKEIEENYLNNKLKMILIQDELNLYRKDNKNAFSCLAEIQNILYNNKKGDV